MKQYKIKGPGKKKEKGRRKANYFNSFLILAVLYLGQCMKTIWKFQIAQ